jgi:hypothetical protein
MFNLSKVDTFPELTRSGRVSNELNQIIDALIASAENNDKFALTGITAGKAYNSMQQRIRAQAKKMNFKVVIRFDSQEEKLYFKASKGEVNASTNNDAIESGKDLKSSDIKSIKTNSAKASAK